jgi:hypothetical protein
MKDKIYSKIVLDFLGAGVEYCNLLEEAYGKYEKIEFFIELSKSLSKLHLATLNLPDFRAEYEEIEIEEFVTEGDYNYIHGRLAEKFGEDNDYLDLIDPLMLEYQEPIGTSLAEFLSDIYQSIKNYNTHYKIKSNDEVLYLANVQCYEDYREYWGARLVSALRAIHLIIHKK